MNPGRGRARWAAAAWLTLASLSLWVLEPLPLLVTAFAALCFLVPPRRPLFGLGAAAAAAALALVPAIPGGGVPTLLWGTVAGVAFAESGRRFPESGVFSRALAGVGVATAFAAAGFAVSGLWKPYDAAVRGRFAEAVGVWQRQWAASGSAPWPEDVRTALENAALLQGQLYPALAGLQTLAILALAWMGWNRLRQGERRPPGRFRELRFADHWVWALVAGLLLVLLPGVPGAVRLGGNLLVFMGAAYTLRGAAVIAALASGAPTVLKVVCGAMAALFFPPAAVFAAALVGLGDTWLDVRRRVNEAAPPA